MSDQDRGPYTPQSDAPLAFDPRQSRGGGGGPAPMTLLVSAIILMALIVGVLLFYRHGVRHPDQPATLVGAPVAETKSAPSASDATSGDQAAGLQVYKSESTPSSEGRTAPAAAPAFESGQEQPVPLPAARPVQPPPPIVNAPLRGVDKPPPVPAPPRPAPKPVVVAKLPPAPPPTPVAAAQPTDSGNVAGSAFGSHSGQSSHAATTQVPTPSHVAKPPPATKAIDLAASGDTTTTKVASAAKPKPKPTTTAEAKPTAEPKPATTSAAGGAVTVQIGAFSSAALAQQGWSDTAHILPSAMSGKSRKVESTVKDGKTYYRSYVGGFASKADAEAFCTSLRARSRPCMVK